MKKSRLIIYALLALFLIIIIYLLLNLSAGRTTFFGKATSSGIFSGANSYVFASPLLARPGGDKIRVTVFALDGQGKGIPNKTVLVNCKEPAVCQSGGVAFDAVQPQSDNLGQAIYDLSSPAVGKFELQASVGGVAIPQTVTVAFQ